MTPRQARLGVDLFTVAMVASVGIALAGLTWRLAGDPGTGLAAVPVAAPVARPVDFSPVIALAPFGSAVAASADGGPQDLQLKGILQAVPRESSAVLISIANGPVTAYYIGQQVGGMAIEAVEADHVVLRGSDGTQILAFPNRLQGGAAGNMIMPPAGTSAPGVEATRSPIPSSARGAAGPIVAAAPAGPPSGAGGFLDTLGATPTTNGYRVGSVSSPIAQAAGLKVGDVVERINGSTVGDAAADRQTLNRAMSSGATRVDILRDGKRMSLTLSPR